MTINVGYTDRIIRSVLGAILIGATVTGLIGGWGWLGVILLATAAFSFCPIYAVLGTTTSPKA